MKRKLIVIGLTAFVLCSCGMPGAQSPRLAEADIGEFSLPRPDDPPVYMRLLDLNIHPDLKEKVNVNFLPGNTALQSAIVNALPFPVTVLAQDEHVDLGSPVAVRARDLTVRGYLKQLANASGYEINFSPQRRTVSVASFVSRTWNLPALAGMGRFNARLGLRAADGDGDDQNRDTQRSHELNTSHDYEDDVWQTLLDNAHCIIRTPSCRPQESA